MTTITTDFGSPQIIKGQLWLVGWPQSLTCSEVNPRLASLVPGWVTTRVFSEESSPCITRVPQPTETPVPNTK